METRNNSRVGAVILAAGMSLRMGEAKQLLQLGGKTLLDHTLENVRGAGVDEIVLVLGFAAEEIARTFSAGATGGLKVAINPAYRDGMASSLRAGLAALSPEIQGALIVLADQPFVRSSTLHRIIEQYRQSKAGIVIPVYKGSRGNPVLLDRSVFPEAIALSGDVGCRAIFDSHLEAIIKVPVQDPGILLDIDSREDLKRMQALAELPASGNSLD